MNIFILDADTQKSAQYHCDKHVVKMILEYAQIMSTVQYLQGVKNSVLYKPTHAHHPAVLWASKSVANYQYLYNLWLALCQEYTKRYGKQHATYTKLRDALKVQSIDTAITIPPSIMDNLAINEPKTLGDVVSNYRHLYLTEKRAIVKYAHSEVPAWFC